MLTAEQLIDKFLETNDRLSRSMRASKKRGYGVEKGRVLTGAEVASLSPKQGILVNGKRAVVISVNTKGSGVELVYTVGAKSFGKEKYLDLSKTDQKTPIQYYQKVTWEGLTQGMKNAYAKGDAKKSCPDCGLAIPRYPGRYPKQCPECGSVLG